MKIEYLLKDVVKNEPWYISYKPETVIAGKKYSSIKVISNPQGLLIDKESHQPLVSTDLAFDTPTGTMENGQESGSFTIRTRELGQTATATILLTLIVEYGEGNDTRDIEIPYTINITNQKNP